MVKKLGSLRFDLGEVISYYPCEYAVYKQKMVPGKYVAIFLRGAPDVVRFPFDTEEDREEFLNDLDHLIKPTEIQRG